MYFIGLGTVAVFSPNGKEICHLEDGDHFGEFCLIFDDLKRRANVVAVDYCEIYRLNRQDFKSTIKQYPESYQMFEHLALERLNSLLIEEEHYKRELNLRQDS